MSEDTDANPEAEGEYFELGDELSTRFVTVPFHLCPLMSSGKNIGRVNDKMAI